MPNSDYGSRAGIAGTVAFMLLPDAGSVMARNILVDGGLVKGL